MSEIVERVADALAESFKSRVAASAGMSFEETKVDLPQRSVWIEYANAAVKIVTDDLQFKIARLELRPGDILVVRAPMRLPSETVARLRDMVRQAAPNVRAMVLDAGLDLSVLTAAEIAERAA